MQNDRKEVLSEEYKQCCGSPVVTRTLPTSSGQLARASRRSVLGPGLIEQGESGPGIDKANILGSSKSMCKSTRLRENKTCTAAWAGWSSRLEEVRGEGTRVEQ